MITGVQPSRERQLIDTIIHQNTVSLVSPHLPNFAVNQSGVSQSRSQAAIINQNELRGILHHLYILCGNAFLVLDIRTSLSKLHYDVCVFEIFAVVYINVIPLETRDTTGNFIRLRLEYVCL